jgi:hypothetical protein
MPRLIMLMIAVCAASGCKVGLTVKNFPPALGPKGVMMQVTTQTRQLSGELLEVRDTALVLLAAGKVRLVPYNAIVSSDVEKTSGGFAIKGLRAPKPGVREHLRLLSRFPQGLAPELLQQLLAGYGQTEMAGVNP